MDVGSWMEWSWCSAGPPPGRCAVPAFLMYGRAARGRSHFPNWEVGIRHEIVRGIFHRENFILLRKNQISDVDTLSYSPYFVKEKFKKTGPSWSMEKSPNDPLPDQDLPRDCLAGSSL